MPISTFSRLAARVAGKLPLRTVVIVPFVLQIVGTVGLVGYLSYRNGQEAVEDLAYQLIDEVDERVEQNLQHYLDVPKHINQSLAAAIGTRVLDWKNFSGLERYFAQQLQIYPTVSNVAIATEQKEFLAVEKSLASDALIIRVLDKSTNYAFHYYAANPQGKRIKLTKVRHDYNPHRDPAKGRPWYQAVQEAGKAIWLPVVNLSQGVDRPILTMVNFLPFDDSNGKFQGVVAASLFLPQLASFLDSLKVGQTGQVFIIDHQGLLIASSTGETPFKQKLNSDYLKNLNPQDWRVVAQNSKNPLTQESVNFLLKQVNKLHQIKQKKKFEFGFHHKRHFLQINPIQDKSELGWLIITVVPEADFMAQIYANKRATILLCIATLIGSITIGIFTSRWITQPIRRLNNAAQDIAQGQWERRVEIERFDELGELTKSFNKMAAQLQQSFAELNSLNEALSQSESKLNQVLEAIPVGVSVHDITGKLIYANQTSRQLLGIETLPDAETEQLAEFYQVYQAGTEQLYPVINMPVVRSLRGERARVDDMEIRLPDRRVPLEVYSAPLLDGTGKIVAAIAAFFDITQRNQTEQLLANYNHALEAKVAERTAELALVNEQLKLEIAERNLLECKLDSSTQQVRTIFESITDIVLVIDAKKSIQIIPTKVINGYANGTNLINSIVEPFFQEDTEEIWLTKVQQVVETKQSMNFDYCISLNNREVWFTACISPLPDNCVVWVARDISDVYYELRLRIQVEQELRKQKELRETIYNESTDALFLVDPETRLITDCNRRAVELFEVTSQEDLIGREGRTLQRRPFTSEEIGEITTQMSQKGFWCREIEYVTRTGKLFWGNIAAKPVQIADQVVNLVRVTDISDRKRAELALRESEARFQAFMNYSPLLAWISDEDGTLLYCNRSLALWAERAASELMGETIWALHPPDIAQQHLENIRYVINTREVLETNESAFCSDGTLHEFLAYKFPLIDANGQCLVGGIAADITARKQAETALQESQAQLKKLTDNVPGSIYAFVLHPDGSISLEYTSSAVRNIHELEPEQVLENPTLMFDHMHPDDRASYNLAVEISVQTLELFQHEWRIITPSGKLKWLRAISKPERRSNGDIVWYGAVFDITDKKQAEEALRRYERIVSATTDAMSLVDRNYIYQVVNQTYLIWHHKRYDEIVGHSVSELMGVEVFESLIKEPLDQCLAGKTAHYQNWFELAVGRRFLNVTYSPYLEADNTISGVVVSLRDLTELQQAEEALHQSEAQLNMIVTNTCDGIMILDEQSQISFANPAAVELFHLPPSELIGYKWGMPLQETTEIELIGSNRQIRIAEMKAVRTTWQGEAAYIVVLRDITERKRAEEALRESANREHAIAQVLQRMRQSLDINTIFRATTEELRRVIQCDRVAIYQFNPDWSGQFVAESVASDWVPLVAEHPLNSPQETVEDTYLQQTQGGAYNQGASYLAVADIYTAGLTPCHIELLERFQAQAYLIVPIFCGNKLWALLASYQNSSSRHWSRSEINTMVQISIQLGIALQQAQLLEETQQQSVALQKAKDAADAANSSKTVFLANMSHELRTPLNGILGYAQILQRDKNATPKQKEGVDMIYQCGTHLLTLINDILDLSKIEAGKLELYPENFDFPFFLTAITEIFRLKAEQKSLTFTYLTLSELPTTIHADEKRLRQVLMNLLSNAVKFTDRGSVTFKVEVVQGSGFMVHGEDVHGSDTSHIDNAVLSTMNPELSTMNKIRFQVEDTGMGISPEQLEKIFLPFEQVGDSSRRAEGTGLGLAITQKILERMGRKIFVESTPGEGSRFGFDLDLPIVSSPMKSTTIKSTDNIIGYSGETRKILIVDDRWENCAVLTNILEPIGFEVEQAADGQEGLEKALEIQPDLILADLVMPVMDGYQMTQRLRQFPEFQNTIILAISANAFAVDRQKGLESGCNDFLPKPIQSEDLLDKIKSYLNLSWIYDSQSEMKSQKLGDESSCYSQIALTEMVIPPQEELLALYDAVSIGYVQGVKREAIRLQQLNPDYTPLATRILELAANFDYEEIAKLIEPYLSENSK